MVRHITLCLLLSAWATLSANNIQVSNVFSTGNNATSGQTTVQFDLSWENSWRTNNGPSNWDAAWVFVKYRVSGGNWQHATITGPGALPTGATVQVMTDNTGALVYRDAVGTGNVNYQDVQLRWDYSGDGVLESDQVDIKVFAIEMVYVPEGAFFVGDGSSPTERNEFYTFGSTNAYQITSEGPIPVGTTNGRLYYDEDDSNPGDRLGPIPAAFPKGFGEFYIAKYETSQQEWVDFFNTLPTGLRETFDLHNATRYQSAGTNKANNRVTNSVNGSDITTTFPGTPVNYVDQKQALAYLDWTGLRPWTELEFEKTARGTLTPIAGEFASGSNDSERIDFIKTNEGDNNSRITNLTANRGHFVFGIERNSGGNTEVNGPLRVGIVSASATNATRLETGGSYYGAMDLSGNLWERTVTVGTPQGRSFVPDHGDGEINPSTGWHNVSGWPAGEVEAYGLKGCAYVSGSGENVERVARCTISARRNAAGNRDRGDHDYALFRGVRSSF